MANTYTQINIQMIFAVKGRMSIIHSSFEDRLFEYLAGILKSRGHFPLAVNGHKDHVHLFFELKPSISISQLANELKSNSSKWINDNRLVQGNFAWQDGFGGFSYARSQRNDVIQYIAKQKEHHRVRTFREEYLLFLQHFEMDFDDKYLFEWIG